MGALSRLRAGRAAELGRTGERAAAALLRSRGYQIVGAGFRARRGELDLVCRRDNVLVVVEVKTRTTDAFGAPLEAVGPRKRQALMSAAAEYRALTEWRGHIRYAVVALTLRRDHSFDAELIEDPFT
ncbi:MAG TPA: YraN family protein [Candidatus Dormibacteraeota bacterium]|nr:YraN family protein [Candidatus Dormibacteraeota bacterium]